MTNMRADLTYLRLSGRTVEAKLQELVSAADFGATPANSAAVNTAAINAAIAYVQNGIVIIPKYVEYTPNSIAHSNTVVLLSYANVGVLTIITKDFGNDPSAYGGIGIKQQGKTGVTFRNVDFGVPGFPFAQFCSMTNGALAGVHTAAIEFDRITSPAAPGTNKARLYMRDDGTGASQLVVQFPTGAPIAIVSQGDGDTVASISHGPVSITNAEKLTISVEAPGASVGDFALASHTSLVTGVMIHAGIVTAGYVEVTLHNMSGANAELAEGILKVKVIKG